MGTASGMSMTDPPWRRSGSERPFMPLAPVREEEGSERVLERWSRSVSESSEPLCLLGGQPLLPVGGLAFATQE